MRELENAVERALILSRGRPLTFEEVGAPVSAVEAPPAPRAAKAPASLERVVADQIRRALAHAGGRVSGADGAARLLDVNPSTLRNRMKKLGIPYGRKAKRGA